MTLVLSFFEPLHHDLITVRRLVQVSNLSLHVLQMFFQLLKGTEQSLSSLMEDVNPVMEITQETLEMFQFSKAFLVLFDQPTGTWMDQRCKWMKTGKYLKKLVSTTGRKVLGRTSFRLVFVTFAVAATQQKLHLSPFDQVKRITICERHILVLALASIGIARQDRRWWRWRILVISVPIGFFSRWLFSGGDWILFIISFLVGRGHLAFYPIIHQ